LPHQIKKHTHSHNNECALFIRKTATSQGFFEIISIMCHVIVVLKGDLKILSMATIFFGGIVGILQMKKAPVYSRGFFVL